MEISTMTGYLSENGFANNRVRRELQQLRLNIQLVQIEAQII